MNKKEYLLKAGWKITPSDNTASLNEYMGFPIDDAVMYQQTQDTLDNLELYEDFNSVTSDKTIPNAGSPTYPTKKLNHSMILKQVVKFIKHRNGDVTIRTVSCSVRFWRKK